MVGRREVTARLDTTTFVEVICHDEQVTPRDDDDGDGAEGASALEFMIHEHRALVRRREASDTHLWRSGTCARSTGRSHGNRPHSHAGIVVVKVVVE